MTFIDSNILVYSIDDNSPEKQRKARAIVARAIGGHGFMVSAQVLNEFTNVALAKMRLTLPEVGKFVTVFNRIKSVPVDCRWTERALAIKAQYGTQFYDSLLIAAAEANGCDEFWSEDLNDGQLYCGVKAPCGSKG